MLNITHLQLSIAKLIDHNNYLINFDGLYPIPPPYKYIYIYILNVKEIIKRVF